jgi:hypothetical protein
MSTVLDETPVAIEDEVSELRCTARHHCDSAGVDHECSVQAVAIFSCMCIAGFCYICQTNLDIITEELDQNNTYCFCLRSSRECFKVTPL